MYLSASRNSAVKQLILITHTVEWFRDELLGVIVTTVSDDSKCQSRRASVKQVPDEYIVDTSYQNIQHVMVPFCNKTCQNPLTTPCDRRVTLLSAGLFPVWSLRRDPKTSETVWGVHWEVTVGRAHSATDKTTLWQTQQTLGSFWPTMKGQTLAVWGLVVSEKPSRRQALKSWLLSG